MPITRQVVSCDRVNLKVKPLGKPTAKANRGESKAQRFFFGFCQQLGITMPSMEHAVKVIFAEIG